MITTVQNKQIRQVIKLKKKFQGEEKNRIICG